VFFNSVESQYVFKVLIIFISLKEIKNYSHMILRNSIILSVFLAFLSCSITSLKDENIQVITQNGIVEGLVNNNSSLSEFFGIPYAKPPVNEFRWKEPQTLDNWEGIKETKQFAKRAVQTNIYGDMIYRSDTVSEDCLYLNIWTPDTGTDKKLPVLVYFHGGGFVAGTGNEPRYDGAKMAQQGIVVVSVNYRLNIFGFLAHPELSEESPYKASGNYGLLDQVAALKWVNKNIAAFGGDTTKVSIAGESAGSISVSMHMASPLSKNLLAGAIGQSGAAINPTFFPKPLNECEKEGVKFLEGTDYSSIADLRQLSAQEISNLYVQSKRYGFPTVIDGYFLEKSLPKVFKAKEQANIPLLLGWTSAELSARAFMQGESLETENFKNKVKEKYPNNFEEVLNVYPHSTEKEIEQSATDLASDDFIVYSTWKWFDLHRKYSKQPIYRYFFDQIKPNNQGLIGAPHASDIEYLMGNLHLIPNIEWTPEDFYISETAVKYIANFIKTGNPNGDGLPYWENANTEKINIPVMNTRNKLEYEDITDEQYFLLDKIYGNASN